ncbi:hypothetical protein [Cohnella cellulosilytica]|uniref:Uncharacterized protein n=1 Tax=Cohnella cellulosilytica TaxID=986710 RepID=A0ABW2FJR3_9BACL
MNKQLIGYAILAAEKEVHLSTRDTERLVAAMSRIMGRAGTDEAEAAADRYADLIQK